MTSLRLGERVRIAAGIPAFDGRVARVILISQPAAKTEPTRSEALREMPHYSVLLDDGRSFRFRGRDLEPLHVR